MYSTHNSSLFVGMYLKTNINYIEELKSLLMYWFFFIFQIIFNKRNFFYSTIYIK